MSIDDNTPLIGRSEAALDAEREDALDTAHIGILEARRNLRAALDPTGLPSTVVMAIASAYEELDEAKAAVRAAR